MINAILKYVILLAGMFCISYGVYLIDSPTLYIIIGFVGVIGYALSTDAGTKIASRGDRP